MANCCNDACSTQAIVSPRYRRVLWIALWVNVVMFGVEIVAGVMADSVSLLADEVDFSGDAANYGLSLAVLAMSLVRRACAALVKGISMGSYGVFVLGKASWSAFFGGVPEAMTMEVRSLRY